jgi:hypothetical protein
MSLGLWDWLVKQRWLATCPRSEARRRGRRERRTEQHIINCAIGYLDMCKWSRVGVAAARSARSASARSIRSTRSTRPVNVLPGRHLITKCGTGGGGGEERLFFFLRQCQVRRFGFSASPGDVYIGRVCSGVRCVRCLGCPVEVSKVF